MRLLIRGCAALFVLARLSVAGNVSYVVLHKPNYEGLVRVSDDGKLRTTIAPAVVGYGLAVDQRGDYIVAAVSSLRRVTASGVVGDIAAAPKGSGWMSVAVDSGGSYIVADNRQHAVWRVSQDGRTVDRVANYPVRSNHDWEDAAVIVDAAGDYLLVEDNGGAHLWRINPAGSVTSIPLHGDKMTSGSSIVSDGAGAYLVTSYRDGAIFRVTPAGGVSRFAHVSGQVSVGVTRNPETGELLVGFGIDHPALLKIAADGSSVAEFAKLGYVSAIIAESGKPVAPVGRDVGQACDELPIPDQISPPNESLFRTYPRTTTLTWTPVPGAVRYGVEVDCYQCCERGQWCTDVGKEWIETEVEGTTYSFYFVGAQLGRWRVWAVGEHGSACDKTGWRLFRYTR